MEEADVLNGDIYGLIAPYATANFWVCFLFIPPRIMKYESNKLSGGPTFANFTIDTTMSSQQTSATNKAFNPPSPSPKLKP